VIPQALSAALGIWLMMAPSLLGYTGTHAARVAWIVGPLVFTFATMSLWAVLRSMRWINVALGLAVSILGLALRSSTSDLFNHVVCGILVAVLSIPRGHLRHAFGGGWRSLLT
jgi:hypothetical protein